LAHIYDSRYIVSGPPATVRFRNYADTKTELLASVRALKEACGLPRLKAHVTTSYNSWAYKYCGEVELPAAWADLARQLGWGEVP
jgi:hypothetical protein